jgi:succinate-semialdehyde dehydrogenase/glutarate-semialdehyde dehydrogenase
MGAAETRRAIEAANAAWPGVAREDRPERARRLLRRWADLMMANQEDLARIMTAEQGKPLAEARARSPTARTFIDWFAEEARRVYGDTIPAHAADKRIVVIKQPIGVVACDHAVEFSERDDHAQGRPGARGAGCAVVCKPANKTPFSALALAVLAERAGFPPGVFNVTGRRTREIGGELCANPACASSPSPAPRRVGKELMASAPPR